MCLFGFIETLEHVGQVIFFDAAARVGDGYEYKMVALVAAHAERATVGREFDGVVDEVSDDLRYFVAVGLDEAMLARKVDLDVDLLVVDARFKRDERTQQQLVDVEHRQLERHLARLDARKVQ
ncbi:hypothetical protein SDC9_197248 [bioreactor metagenome]|uniref:Uncharacterized protein n=1 Tax=bioreactor metagenome TaxID=1076179 RepID=A0A645IFA3_9ZZZZ